MHLALDDHRVDEAAEIVGGDELHDLGVAGLRVDLDLADVAAGREGEVGRVVERAFLQARLHARRQIVRRIGGEADLCPGQLLVGAGDAHLAVGDLDVAFRGFHQMRGDLLRLRLDLVERLDDRRHADRAGARAVGAHAELHLVGVAVHDRDIARSAGRSAATTTCAKVVSWPWPWLCEPVSTSIVPTGLTRTSADSHRPTPAPSEPTA